MWLAIGKGKVMSEIFYPSVVVELSEEDGGGYAAYAPDLYGCMGDGETPAEAVADLQDAVLEWIDETKRMGRPVPAPGSVAQSNSEFQARLMEIAERQHRTLGDQNALLGRQDEIIRQQQTMLDELASLSDQLIDALDRQALPSRVNAAWTYIGTSQINVLPVHIINKVLAHN